MTERSAPDDTRKLIGTVMLLLSEIGLFGSFLAFGSVVFELPSQVVFRACIGLVISFIVLCAACVLLRTASALWQIPPLCFALAAIAIGARILITLLFNHPQLLFGKVGLVGVSLLAGGVAVGWGMKALQARYLPKHGA